MASPVLLPTRARCLRCPWTAEGAAADKAADKHTKDAKTGHPTIVVTEASREQAERRARWAAEAAR